MRTAIYVDGFNLYYCMKPSPYRWIDLKALAANVALLPREIAETSIRIPAEWAARETAAGVR